MTYLDRDSSNPIKIHKINYSIDYTIRGFHKKLCLLSNDLKLCNPKIGSLPPLLCLKKSDMISWSQLYINLNQLFYII